MIRGAKSGEQFGFSLGPPSAIIETDEREELAERTPSFSLGPPSAIIETKQQSIFIRERFKVSV